MINEDHSHAVILPITSKIMRIESCPAEPPSERHSSLEMRQQHFAKFDFRWSESALRPGPQQGNVSKALGINPKGQPQALVKTAAVQVLMIHLAASEILAGYHLPSRDDLSRNPHWTFLRPDVSVKPEPEHLTLIIFTAQAVRYTDDVSTIRSPRADIGKPGV